MDRRKWMYNIERSTPEYINGLSEYIKTAEDHQTNTGEARISCPCKDCAHFICHDDIETIRCHLFKHGFTDNYTCNNQNINDMLQDAEHNTELDMEKLQQLFVESEKPLYVGCTKFTKLLAVLQLLTVKAEHGLSYVGFNKLLELFNKMLPENNELPTSTYQAKKLMCPLGLEVKRIDACLKDCILYRNGYKDLHKCPGPKQLGNDIDVYLEPLTDDMIDLWDKGVKVYDAYKKERLKLFAMIFCTISDFLAYGNLSGYGTKGEKACPVCDKDTHSRWLTNYRINAQKDMVEMGIRDELAPQEIVIKEQEIKALGHVYLHYMYPFERYMGFLKGYVRNRSRPEGSIAEGYLSGEVVSFCTSYIDGISDIGVLKSRHEDEKSTVQNSEVTLVATTTDNSRLLVTKKSYYGVIEEIWELDYNTFLVHLFKCKWVDNIRGVKVDKDGLTYVNLSTNSYSSDPFILAKQATQIFYVEDPSDTRWNIVMHSKRSIVGVENVVDRDEYNHFDELPPFSIGIQSVDEILDDTIYLKSGHQEGHEADD
nr:hypothetical protein [Tanacetum cinerariifolium]